MPTDTPEEPRTIAETELAKTLGITRTVLQEERALRLETPRHWGLKKSAVHYTAEGVRELCGRLDLALPDGWAEGAEKEGAETEDGQEPIAKGKGTDGAPADDVLTVLVTRRAARNPRIVFAREKKDGGAAAEPPAPEIAVRVRAADAVAIGQELRVRMAGNLADLFGPQPRPAHRRRHPRPAARA